MKLTIADKFKPLLNVQEGKAGDVTTVKAEVVAINKKGIFISGEDHCQVPVKVDYLEGEKTLSVGDAITFQLDSGLLIGRDVVKSVARTPERTGRGSPDRSMKSNGF